MHFSTKTKLYPQHPQEVLTLLHYEQPHPKTLTHDPRWTTHSHSWSSGFFCLNKPRVLLALLLMCTLFLLYISHVWPAWSWVKDLYPKYVYLLMTWSAREKKTWFVNQVSASYSRMLADLVPGRKAWRCHDFHFQKCSTLQMTSH